MFGFGGWDVFMIYLLKIKSFMTYCSKYQLIPIPTVDQNIERVIVKIGIKG